MNWYICSAPCRSWMSRSYLGCQILIPRCRRSSRPPTAFPGGAGNRPVRAAARDVRPPPDRRGPGCDPDAVAHAARRGASASWTIVGDPAQSAWTDTDEADRAIEEIIGTAPVRHFRMSTNYRSPSEVFDLAARSSSQTFRMLTSPLRRARPVFEPRLLVPADAVPGDPTIAAAMINVVRTLLDRGGRYGRGDLPAVNQR